MKRLLAPTSILLAMIVLAVNTRSGPHVSDRGGEQPERDCAVELVVACKLARPDSSRIRVTSNTGIV